MQEDAVAAFPGQPKHGRAHGGNPDWHVRVADRAGVEEVGQQRELVEVAGEPQAPVALEGRAVLLLGPPGSGIRADRGRTH